MSHGHTRNTSTITANVPPEAKPTPLLSHLAWRPIPDPTGSLTDERVLPNHLVLKMYYAPMICVLVGSGLAVFVFGIRPNGGELGPPLPPSLHSFGDHQGGCWLPLLQPQPYYRLMTA